MRNIRARHSAYRVQIADRAVTRQALLDILIGPPPTYPGETYFHRDLARMTQAELRREKARVRLRLILEDNPDAWWLDRLARVEEELRGA